MKALQCIELAGPEKLVFGEVEDPKPNAGEVLVDVKAASVNFPDVLMVQGLYQFQPPMPFIPGAECSGVISEVGEDVTSCKPGDHVFVMAGDLNTLPPGSLKLKDFSDSVCPKEGPFDADDFSEETTWLAPFYEAYQSAVPLPDYQENNAAYFTHTTNKEGFWNRKLDYLFTNGTFVPGSDITHQGSWAGGVNTMELSDHAPVTVVLEVGP